MSVYNSLFLKFSRVLTSKNENLNYSLEEREIFNLLS